jgi:hypothetical protein
MSHIRTSYKKIAIKKLLSFLFSSLGITISLMATTEKNHQVFAKCPNGTHKSPTIFVSKLHHLRIVVMMVVRKLAQLTIWGQKVLQIMTIRTTPLSADNISTTSAFFYDTREGYLLLKSKGM